MHLQIRSLALVGVATMLLLPPHPPSAQAAKPGKSRTTQPSKKKGKKKPALPLTWDRPFDISPVAAHRRVATDGQGHYLVYFPYAVQRKLPKGYSTYHTLFYSRDGKSFYANPSTRGSGGNGKWSLNFRDPRHPEDGHARTTSVVVTNDAGATLELRCDTMRRTFKELSGPQSKVVLDGATFRDRLWNRKPVLLARDDRGVYYYVDNAIAPFKSRDYRVYMGMRGQLKVLRLKGVADDNAGNVFATKSGNLRLLQKHNRRGPLAKDAITWIQGKRQRSLTNVDLWLSSALIHKELGPYVGKRMGTPCDDL